MDRDIDRYIYIYIDVCVCGCFGEQGDVGIKGRLKSVVSLGLERAGS